MSGLGKGWAEAGLTERGLPLCALLPGQLLMWWASFSKSWPLSEVGLPPLHLWQGQGFHMYKALEFVFPRRSVGLQIQNISPYSLA